MKEVLNEKQSSFFLAMESLVISHSRVRGFRSRNRARCVSAVDGGGGLCLCLNCKEGVEQQSQTRRHANTPRAELFIHLSHAMNREGGGGGEDLKYNVLSPEDNCVHVCVMMVGGRV